MKKYSTIGNTNKKCRILILYLTQLSRKYIAIVLLIIIIIVIIIIIILKE
jgi:hypothetical protein